MSGSKGPKSSAGANGINQGEHILELNGADKNPYFRMHVFRSQSRNLTVWHWHTKEDGFVNHHGQIVLRHNSLPNWGSK